MKRTNIIIDEKLVEEGKKATGLKTSRAVIDYALRELLRHHNQRRILDFKGKVKWEGDIEAMRKTRGVA